jgi:hypothetical protein
MMKYARNAGLLVILLSACTGDAADDEGSSGQEGESVAESEAAILQGATKASFAGTVLLDTDTMSCTATVLSEHWLLTAAHCIDDLAPVTNAVVSVAFGSDGKPEKVYDEQPILRFVHPSYVGSPSYDIGLVQLRSHGIDTTAIGRAKLNAGTSTIPSSNMIIAGFGRGTDPGVSMDCDDAGGGILRYRGQKATGSNSTVAWTDDDWHCPGDSGGPWMSYFISGGHQYVQFAVHSGDAWDLSKGYHERGATIKSTRAWIESTMQIEAPYRFTYSATPGSHNGFSYRTYNEAGFVLAPLELGGFCVEPDGLDNGSPLVLRTCDGSNEQLWWLRATGEIKHPVANRCLDIEGAASADGTKAQLWDCHGGRNQRFRHNADGSIHYGMDYGMCVDLQWGNFAVGTPLWLWGCNGSSAQVFEFAN